MRFARREQGLGRADRRGKKEELVKGSKWGSREVRNRAVNGKVEVLGKLTREGLDEKLDLWLEIAHFVMYQ